MFIDAMIVQWIDALASSKAEEGHPQVALYTPPPLLAVRSCIAHRVERY